MLNLFKSKTHHITSLCLVVDVRRRGFVYLDKMIEILQTISPSSTSAADDGRELKKALMNLVAKQKNGSWIVDYNEFVKKIDQLATATQQHQEQQEESVSPSSRSSKNTKKNNNLTTLERLSQSRSPEIIAFNNHNNNKRNIHQQLEEESDEDHYHQQSLASTRAPTQTPERNNNNNNNKEKELNDWKAAEQHLMSVSIPKQNNNNSPSPSSTARRQNNNNNNNQQQQKDATETLRQMLKGELDRVSDNNPQVFIDYLISASNPSKQHRNREIWMVKVSQLEEALASLYAHKSRLQLQGDPSPSKSHNNVFVQPPEWVMTRARKIGQAPFMSVMNSNHHSTSSPSSSSPSSSFGLHCESSSKAKEIRRKTRDWMLANPQLNVDEWIDASYLLETVYLS